jgi:hypothetical protein
MDQLDSTCTAPHRVAAAEQREDGAGDGGVHVGQRKLVKVHHPDVLIVGKRGQGGLEELQDLHAVLGVGAWRFIARRAVERYYSWMNLSHLYTGFKV